MIFDCLYHPVNLSGKNLKTVAFKLLLLVFLLCFYQLAESNEVETKSVSVVEKEKYSFYVRAYEEVIKFQPSIYDPGEISVRSEPELVLMKILFMIANNRDDYISYFDSAYSSQNSGWLDAIDGAVVELVKRVDYGIKLTRHAILSVEIVDGDESLYEEFGFVRDRKTREWKLTELSGGVIADNWDFSGESLEITNDELSENAALCEWRPNEKCKNFIPE